ncbi:isopeptide-forming domain-containing fimbrial protein [Bifidobacterium pullorum subsp. gallinarum]|uniref:Isopeptide-forming domain-containing fimbrial protein n=1 Tax=Bifidobacterium pullorum subsp. gallinarum TaxID=78344 RepID=A0A4P6E469_9BIFI|nr:SpaA isopeptide-forming pilin-related protein [Bifidobacterium pullorum]QAY32989.1 isopeptide-forming domain-containing fimbrial protein [Bifidobacterium pullorum subsp. gallinarum]
MNGKKSLAAACAAAALLSGLAFSGTAMAAGQATITLNAAQGSSLAGHTFEVYRIGGYYDVVADGGKVKSFGVRGDTTSNAWAKDAIGDYNQSADDDIEVPLGYDEAGAIAALADKGTALQIRGAAKALAESSRLPAAVKSVQGSGSRTVIDVEEGYYLVVDSEGAPMLIGTKIQGMDLKDTTLGVTTIKSKSLTVDKKIGADAGSLKDDGSYTVGSTVTQTITTSVPNSKLGGALAWKITDTPTGLAYVKGSLTAKLKDGTNVTGLLKVYDTAGANVPGDASLVDALGKRTDPDLTVPKDGFVIDANQLMQTHPDKQVIITYKAKVTGHDASNTARISTVFADGADTTPVEDEDESTNSDYGFRLDKTSFDDRSLKVNGAGFKIKDQDLGKWLSYDHATGMWSEAADQAAATEFLTGDTNHDSKVDSTDDTAKAGRLEFAGLGAGDYLIQETTAPEGFSSYGIAMPSLTVTITEDGQVTFNGKDLPALTTDDGDGSVTVANIASLTDLPQTGGAWSALPWIIAALFAGGIGLTAIRTGGKVRRNTSR